MIDAERGERLSGAPLGFPGQGQQDVLGADEAMAKLARLHAGQTHDLASTVCQMLGQSDESCLSMAANTDFRLAWRRS
jgi:hypothetical protein